MEDKKEKISVIVSPEKNEKSDPKKSFWHINREMLPYKLHFLLFVGGSGVIFPFQTAFGITVLGLTASNIAACYTALQVCIFVMKPGFGYLADYFNRLKAVIMGLAVIQCLFFLCMINIPNTDMPGINAIHFSNTSENNTYCHLCYNSDALNKLTPKFYLDDEHFSQILSSSDNNMVNGISLNCLSNNINSTNYESFEIKLSVYNFSHVDSLFSENYQAMNTSEDYLNVLYVETSKISAICLLEIDKFFNDLNSSLYDINQYCYSLSNESIFKTQNLLTKSELTSIICNNWHTKTFLQKKDEHSIGIANFKTYQFWAFAACLILTCVSGSTEFTMSDTACYESIKGNDYGQQRVWGAISWGIMASFGGYLIDSTQSYTAVWYIYAAFTILQIWNLSRMNLLKPDFSQNILKDMKTIFSSIEFLCFEAGVFMNGIFTGIIWYYLTWFIVDIGGNKLVIGLAHTVQCFLGEVPAMYFSGWLIKKLGHFNLVSLALLSHGIRFFLYSYLYNPYWILPIECTHGFTFGSFYAAMTSYGKLNSKPGTEATTQSILCTTYEALGCGVGCLITGVCLELYGGHATFFYTSFLCVAATMINVLSTFFIGFRKGSRDVTKSEARTNRY